MSDELEPDAKPPATAARDALPEDLDVTNFVGPTVFPDVAKRRVAGTIYLVLAVDVPRAVDARARTGACSPSACCSR